MAYDAREIANFILDYCDHNVGPISHLALQKVLFFCHAWSMVDLNKRLIDQKFEAWEHGPVLQNLYHEFKKFGHNPITARATRLDLETGERCIAEYELDEHTKELLERVVSFYARLNPGQLVEMSHAIGGPWHKVWNHGAATNPGMTLDDREIYVFYSKEYRGFKAQ